MILAANTGEGSNQANQRAELLLLPLICRLQKCKRRNETWARKVVAELSELSLSHHVDLLTSKLLTAEGFWELLTAQEIRAERRRLMGKIDALANWRIIGDAVLARPREREPGRETKPAGALKALHEATRRNAARKAAAFTPCRCLRARQGNENLFTCIHTCLSRVFRSTAC